MMSLPTRNPESTPGSTNVQGVPRSVVASLHLPLVAVTTVLLTAFLLQHLASDQTGTSLMQATAAIRNESVPGSGDLISISTASPGELRNKLRRQFRTPIQRTTDEQFAESSSLNMDIADDLTFPDELQLEPERLPDEDDQAFQNLLQEISRTSGVTVRTEISGASVFHIHGQLTSNSVSLLPALRSLLLSLKPLLQDEFRLELTVWAATPTESAMIAAVHTASQLQHEAATLLRETPATDRSAHSVEENPAGHETGLTAAVSTERLSAATAVWIHPRQTRPAVTLTLHRSANSGAVD
jgi:hypothetical protein